MKELRITMDKFRFVKFLQSKKINVIFKNTTPYLLKKNDINMGHYLFNDNLIIKLKNKYFPIFFFLSFFFIKESWPINTFVYMQNQIKCQLLRIVILPSNTRANLFPLNNKLYNNNMYYYEIRTHFKL